MILRWLVNIEIIKPAVKKSKIFPIHCINKCVLGLNPKLNTLNQRLKSQTTRIQLCLLTRVLNELIKNNPARAENIRR
jgi:hypothetical protein